MKKNYFLTLLLTLCFGLTSLGQVFITELADPNDNSAARYIELYNAGDSSVDLEGWRIDKYTNASETVSQSITLTGLIESKGFFIIATGPEDTEFFDIWGFSPNQWDTGGNNVAGSNGDDNLEVYDSSNVLIDQFGVPGEDGTGTAHEFEDGRAERKATVTQGNPTWDANEWNIDNDSGGGDGPIDADAGVFDPGAWIGTSTDPIISVGAPITGLDYFEGYGPSMEGVFTVGGLNLTTDISVAAPTNFEISLTSGGTFTNSIVLTPTDGIIGSTIIYVRLKADLGVGSYSEDLTVSYTGLDDVLIALSGEISPADPQFSFTGDLDDFSYLLADGGPSVEDTFTVEGLFLNDDLIITTPTGFEVSLTTEAGFDSSLTITPSSGAIESTTIYVRLKAGLEEDSYGGDITLASAGLESKTISVIGNVFGETTKSMLITGVYDGPLTGGRPKGVELYVLNDIEDLSSYGISSVSNGGGSTAGEIEFVFPEVSVSEGTYIYVTTHIEEFLEFFGEEATYESNFVSINGDDSIELYEKGQIIDVFGEVDNNSDITWGYLDGWAYRKSNTGPEGTTFTIDNWTYSGENGLEGGTSNATATTPFPIGTYKNSTASLANNTIEGFKTYPNPITNKSFTVSSNSTDVKEVAIFSVIGKKVFSTSFSGLNKNLDVSNLSSGVYILKVTEGSKLATKKLVIK
ncbi:lamin tail domain-containing protein [Polaribacter sargassicola]|uniref:lamin tail domain-containing protein n=1 Tax=Polaribacter sargassicola TaxID=2836891 RepID=UPI001F24EDBF|nr:lamin tail domain-containing protein [Polaribacter sp. DS7-9]MCG1035349.1 lamin tail domain-containing protein [Polaribacter sp. DS7-9]